MSVTLNATSARCHPYVSDVLIFLSLSYQALAPLLGKKPHREPIRITLACRAASIDLNMAAQGHLAAAMSGDVPDIVAIQLVSKGPEPAVPTARGMKDLSTRLLCAMFGIFVERAVDWARREYTTGYDKFPPVLNFCRVVRNATVHGGTININSPNAPTVSWRGLTYNYNDAGRSIINTGDLSGGDLILLMLELEEELNLIGAPFDLGWRRTKNAPHSLA